MGYQLINTLYWNRVEGEKGDKLVFVLKDEKGNKSFQIVEKPVVTYYMTKPEHWGDDIGVYLDEQHTISYVPMDKVTPVKAYYKDLYPSIYRNLKDSRLEAFYKETLASGNQINKKLRQMHLDDRLHGSDINVQDYYIAQFLKKYNYEENFIGITKTFFDIEVDIADLEGFPDPEKAEVPVNVITLVDEQTLTSYSYCLKYEHDGYNKVMRDKEAFKKRLKEKYKKIEEKLGQPLNFEIIEFDDELELITAFFDAINKDIKPDFCCAWNIAFDFVYLYNRILNIGGSTEKIMCADELVYKQAYYKLDTRNQDPADRSDSYFVSGYTVYLDLMCLYANLRKASGKKESYALDFIGELEVGMKKDKLESDFKTVHYDDYESFLTYNIQDTIMLMMIEMKNNDINVYYTISMITQTRIEKALKKTICLRNFAGTFYQKLGLVISNNRSSQFPKQDKIKGAFVGDPNNIDNIGMKIVYNPSNRMLELVVDLDLASLYPNITITFNISPETCLGKITVRDAMGNDITDQFVDDYTSGDVINFGIKYLGLPTVEEMYKIVKEILEESENEAV